MATVDETLAARTAMGAALASGLDTLSLRQEVTFNLYVQVVLPLDGYVFWIRADILSSSAMFNVSMFNRFYFNQISQPFPALSFSALGSLHYSTESRQTHDANYAAHRVVFTSQEPLQNMTAISPALMYIATFDGPSPQTPDAPRGTSAIRFSFSTRGSHYQQANLWHYTGFAVYPFMATQIVDDPALISNADLIVSNSLPLWLSYARSSPDWPVPVPRPPVLFYPSMLSPDNLIPPYVTVRIEPQGTNYDQAMPFLTDMTDQYSLTRETILLTAYGLNNRIASDLLYSILQHSYDTEEFGIINVPTIRDEKEGQNELNVLAQKKTIAFEISYNQAVVRNVARQLIASSVASVEPSDC